LFMIDSIMATSSRDVRYVRVMKILLNTFNYAQNVLLITAHRCRPTQRRDVITHLLARSMQCTIYSSDKRTGIVGLRALYNSVGILKLTEVDIDVPK